MQDSHLTLKFWETYEAARRPQPPNVIDRVSWAYTRPRRSGHVRPTREHKDVVLRALSKAKTLLSTSVRAYLICLGTYNRGVADCLEMMDVMVRMMA
jgi:hypothetical protein